MDTTAITVIGTVNGGKVHLAFGKNGRIMCRTGAYEYLTDVIAELADDGGQEDTIAVLAAHNVKPSKLCKSCFSPRLAATYRAKS
jgi:hypothetical protein